MIGRSKKTWPLSQAPLLTLFMCVCGRKETHVDFLCNSTLCMGQFAYVHVTFIMMLKTNSLLWEYLCRATEATFSDMYLFRRQRDPFKWSSSEGKGIHSNGHLQKAKGSIQMVIFLFMYMSIVCHIGVKSSNCLRVRMHEMRFVAVQTYPHPHAKQPIELRLVI